MMAQGGGGGTVEGIPSTEAVAGDVCMYGISEGKLIIVNDYDVSKYPIDKYPPIGVVVVPGSHGHYENGKCAIASLVIMDCNTPQQGSTEYNTSSAMCWGNPNLDVLSTRNFGKIAYVGSEGNVGANVIGLSGNNVSCLAVQERFGFVKNPYDTKTTYGGDDVGEYYAPSPYNNDGTFNSEFSRITSPSSTANCLSDLDGYNNTKKIINTRGSKDYSSWKPTYNNVSDYPAASCCDMYFTQGTKQGDWYLPSVGELAYYCARYTDIESKLSKLKLSGVQVCEPNIYTGIWISTEVNKNNAWMVYMMYCNIYKNMSKTKEYYSRAFLQV